MADQLKTAHTEQKDRTVPDSEQMRRSVQTDEFEREFTADGVAAETECGEESCAAA